MLDTATAPAYLTAPEHELTNGDIAAEIGAMLGLPPDPNQRMLLDGIYAESKPGRLAAAETVVIGPRQNIKSSTLEVAAVTDVVVFAEPLHIWTAHRTKTMHGAFEDMRDRIEGCDYLRKRFRKPREANGQEALELLTGERIEFYSRSKGGGRGRTAGKVTVDEALILDAAALGALLPTMATFINGQVRYGSSAGMKTSDALRAIRDRGRSGVSPKTFYAEWCAPFRECAVADCEHRVGTDGCALDDESLWVPANPALGDRITVETLRDLRAALPPAEFMREFLGWWDDPDEDKDGPIPLELWARLVVKDDIRPPRLALAVECSTDQKWTAIGLAGERPDGRTQVELTDYKQGSAWAVQRMIDLKSRLTPAAVVIDPRSPAGALIADLEDAGVDVTTTSAQDVTHACASMLNMAADGRLAHRNDPDLTAALRLAQTKPLSDSWAWDRKASNVASLFAVTLALGGWLKARGNEPRVRTL